jgi:hypothetical protein
VAGHADDGVGADDAPRLGVGRVGLADMDAVGAARRGDVGPIVDDEGDVARLAGRTEQVAGVAQRLVVEILEAELNAGDVIGVERFRERVAEARRFDLGRRDEIEPAALVAQSCPL